MTTPAGELAHVAYLGAFVVSGVLCRNDLYRDTEGLYWAEPTQTNPDGTWGSALHCLYATDECAATSEALRAHMVLLGRDGLDLKAITIIHHAPGLADSAAQIEPCSPHVH